MIKIIFKIINKLEYLLYDIRGYIKKIQFESYGKNVKFFGQCYMKNPHNIKIGSDVTFNDGAYLNALGGIEIGNNVSISALSIVVSTGLEPNTLSYSKKHINKKIFIGNNVQLGVGSIVLAGVHIGDNVIVGAGSVVTKDIETNSIVAGSPATIIRKLT